MSMIQLHTMERVPPLHPDSLTREPHIHFRSLTLQKDSPLKTKVYNAFDSFVSAQVALGVDYNANDINASHTDFSDIKLLIESGDCKAAVALAMNEQGEVMGIKVAVMNPSMISKHMRVPYTYTTVRRDVTQQGIGQKLSLIGSGELFQAGYDYYETSVTPISLAMIRKTGLPFEEAPPINNESKTRIRVTLSEVALRQAYAKAGLDFDQHEQYHTTDF